MNTTYEEIKRGQIRYINSGYEDDTNSKKIAVIVSADSINRTGDGYMIAYMTLQPNSDMPTHVTTRSSGRLSTVMCEKIFTTRGDRIDECIGELTDTEMDMLDSCLAIALGLSVGRKNKEKA